MCWCGYQRVSGDFLSLHSSLSLSLSLSFLVAYWVCEGVWRFELLNTLRRWKKLKDSLSVMMKERFSISVKVYQKATGSVIAAWYSASIKIIFSVVQSKDTCTVLSIVNWALFKRILKCSWKKHGILWAVRKCSLFTWVVLSHLIWWFACFCLFVCLSFLF